MITYRPHIVLRRNHWRVYWRSVDYTVGGLPVPVEQIVWPSGSSFVSTHVRTGPGAMAAYAFCTVLNDKRRATQQTLRGF